MKNTRVVIIEDDEPLGRSLAEWLGQDHEVIYYSSAKEFLNAVNNFEFEDGVPTGILLDFQMPGMTGVELQSTLKAMNIEFPIVFMSGNALQADIIDAWHGGAVDFILKPLSGVIISNALITLFSKVEKIKTEITLVDMDQEIIDIPISKREAEVLLLLGGGNRQNKVAEILDISLRTVKKHRASLKDKLNLNTPIELSKFFLKYKLSIEKLAANRSD